MLKEILSLSSATVSQLATRLSHHSSPHADILLSAQGKAGILTTAFSICGKLVTNHTTLLLHVTWKHRKRFLFPLFLTQLILLVAEKFVAQAFKSFTSRSVFLKYCLELAASLWPKGLWHNLGNKHLFSVFIVHIQKFHESLFPAISGISQVFIVNFMGFSLTCWVFLLTFSFQDLFRAPSLPPSPSLQALDT